MRFLIALSLLWCGLSWTPLAVILSESLGTQVHASSSLQRVEDSADSCRYQMPDWNNCHRSREIDEQRLWRNSLCTFAYADVSSCDMQGMRLQLAYAPFLRVNHADFSGADLSSADLRHLHAHGAHFSGAVFSNAKLSNSNLRRASLTRATAHRADLAYSDLIHANLSNADFSHATMTFAKLRNAALANTDFSYADLRHADFSGASGLREIRWTGARLFGAHGLPPAVVPGGEEQDAGSESHCVAWCVEFGCECESGDSVGKKRAALDVTLVLFGIVVGICIFVVISLLLMLAMYVRNRSHKAKRSRAARREKQKKKPAARTTLKSSRPIPAPSQPQVSARASTVAASSSTQSRATKDNSKTD